MKLTIEITMDGAAFEKREVEEVEFVLRDWDRIARLLMCAPPASCRLRDSNGNTCGFARVTEENAANLAETA